MQRWVEQHDAYVQRASNGGVPLLFLGDSLTYAWGLDGRQVWQSDFAPLDAVAFGIGGDRTGDVLWRIEHGEVPADVRTVVLLVGTNDLASGSGADATADGVVACVRAIAAHAPKATIVVLGLLPRGAGHADTAIRKSVAEVNARLAKLDDGKNVRYLDLSPAFVDSAGAVRPELYHPDLIHLSAAGYQAWADMLRPALARVRR